MSVDWPLISLAELYDIRSGLSKPAKDFGTGFPFLSFKDVFYNFFVPDKLTELVQTNERERESCSIKRGDVFLTRTSETIHELGMSCVALKNYEQATFNGFTKRLRPKSGTDLLPEYVGYYLRSPSFRKEMMAFSTLMSTRASLNNEMISRLNLLVPPRREQETIARVLKRLDDKIELNNQTNQTLEQIAQAIFKSWFVDFEPVKAKMAVLEAGGTAEQAELAAMSVISAKDEAALKQLQAEQPDAYAELAQTAALFPSAMEESELGEIPEGWGISKLKSLSEKISKGTTPRKPDIANATDPSMIPFIKVKDISDDGEINRGGLENIPSSIHEKALKRSILTTDDLLFSIAGTIGRVSIVDDDLDNSNTNQAVAFVRLSDKENFLELCFLTLKSKRVQEEIASKVVQGVQANASLTNIGDIQVVVPDDPVLMAWKKIIYPFISEKRNLSGLSRRLSSLRDTLLPKLLSGDLPITNTEVA